MYDTETGIMNRLISGFRPLIGRFNQGFYIGKEFGKVVESVRPRAKQAGWSAQKFDNAVDQAFELAKTQNKGEENAA